MLPIKVGSRVWRARNARPGPWLFGRVIGISAGAATVVWDGGECVTVPLADLQCLDDPPRRTSNPPFFAVGC